MSKKILAVDLDDTLFDDDKGICKENITALNELLDNGHILAVDTGRPVHVMKNLLHEYGLFDRENVYLLGYQGTVCMRSVDSKIIFGHYLNNAPAIKLLNYAKTSGLSTIAFEYGHIYSYRNDSNIERYSALSKETIEVVSSFDTLANHDLTKIMVIDFDNNDLLFEFKAAHEDEMSSDFVSMFSNVAFLEYVAKGFSKGMGLKELAAFLNIPLEDTVACGDERNDISMIKAAHIGVAVSNAREELKKEADYITVKDNNNGAVAEVIYKFIVDAK